MKHLEKLIAGLLIISGLGCLSMAATGMTMGSTAHFLHSLLTVCLWTAVPLVIFGILYWTYFKKRR